MRGPNAVDLYFPASASHSPSISAITSGVFVSRSLAKRTREYPGILQLSDPQNYYLSTQKEAGLESAISPHLFQGSGQLSKCNETYFTVLYN